MCGACGSSVLSRCPRWREQHGSNEKGRRNARGESPLVGFGGGESDATRGGRLRRRASSDRALKGSTPHAPNICQLVFSPLFSSLLSSLFFSSLLFPSFPLLVGAAAHTCTILLYVHPNWLPCAFDACTYVEEETKKERRRVHGERASSGKVQERLPPLPPPLVAARGKIASPTAEELSKKARSNNQKNCNPSQVCKVSFPRWKRAIVSTLLEKFQTVERPII